MGDVLRLNLDINNNLNESIERNKRKMKGFNSLVEENAHKFEDINESSSRLTRTKEKLIDRTATWRSGLRGVNRAFRSMRRVVDTILPGFLALFSVATIMDSVRGFLQMEQSLARVSFRMGEGAEGLETMRTEAVALQKELGFAADTAGELMEGLARLRVPAEEMGELARATGMFAELSGLSNEQSVNFAGNLRRAGNLGTEAIGNVMGSMIEMQRAVGLTESEMGDLTDTIENATVHLGNMGRTAQEIEDFSSGVVGLAGAFTEVGIEASRASDIIEGLLDPGQVEDNALLISQLGLSMEDAFTGNLDPQQIARGFRDIGENLSNMSAPAAARMAQQMGLSYQEAQRLQDFDSSQIERVAEAMAEGKSGAEAMAAAREDEATTQDKLERSMEKIKGQFVEVAKVLMPMIENVVGFIADNMDKVTGAITWVVETFKGLPGYAKLLIPAFLIGIRLIAGMITRRLGAAFHTVATETSEQLKRGTVEAMEQGARKGRKAMERELGEDPKKVDFEMRQKGSIPYKRMIAQQEKWQANAEASSGIANRIASTYANVAGSLAKQSKATSSLYAKTEAWHQSNRQGYQELINQRKSYEESIKNSTEELQRQKTTMSSRLQFLDEEIQKAKDRNATDSEMNELSRRRRKLDKEFVKISSQIGETLHENNNVRGIAAQRISQLQEREQRRAKMLSDNQILEIKMEERKHQERVDNSQQQMQTLTQEINKQNQRLRVMERSNKYTSADIEAQRELVKSQREKFNMEQRSFEQAQSTLGQYKKQNQAILDQAEAREIQGLESERQLEAEMTFRDRIAERARQGWFNVTEGVRERFEDAAHGARTAFGGLRDAVRPRNIAAGLKAGARGLGNRIRGIFSREPVEVEAQARERRRGPGIGSLLGPLAIIGGLLMRLEPVQKALNQLMEQLQEPLSMLSDALMPLVDVILDVALPVVMELVETLAPIIKSLVGTLADALMPIISKVLGALGPLISSLVGVIGPLLEVVISLIGPLITFLLPPLIWILGLAVEIIGKLIEGIGRMAMFMMELPERIMFHMPKMLGGQGGEGTFEASQELRDNAIYQAIQSVKHAGQDMAKAGRDMRSSIGGSEMIDSVEEGTAKGTAKGSAQAQVNWTPAQLAATRDGIEEVQKGSYEITGEEKSHEQEIANNTSQMIEEERKTRETLQAMNRSQEEREEKRKGASRRDSLRQMQQGPNKGTDTSVAPDIGGSL